MGGQNKKPLGYTIVEVMIVLAVSGVMFLIAMTFISGKQEKTAFMEGVNDTASNIQDIIEQVNDGKYSDIPIACTTSSGQPQITTTATTKQGQNPPCVFFGKFVQFGIHGQPASNYEVFSMAANRLTAAGGAATTYYPSGSANTYPVPIVDTSGSPYPLDLTVQNSISQNLSVGWVHINGGSTNYYGFGFAEGLGTLTGTNYANGVQTANLVYAPSLTTSQTEAQAIVTLKSTTAYASLAPANSAAICLSDGAKSARIDVGAANGNPLAVNVTILNSASCP